VKKLCAKWSIDFTFSITSTKTTSKFFDELYGDAIERRTEEHFKVNVYYLNLFTASI